MSGPRLTASYSTRITASPRLERQRPAMPDVDTADEDEILDLVANCLTHGDDLDRLGDSRPHLVAVLHLVETLALRSETLDDRVRGLERELAEIRAAKVLLEERLVAVTLDRTALSVAGMDSARINAHADTDVVDDPDDPSAPRPDRAITVRIRKMTMAEMTLDTPNTGETP